MADDALSRIRSSKLSSVFNKLAGTSSWPKGGGVFGKVLASNKPGRIIMSADIIETVLTDSAIPIAGCKYLEFCNAIFYILYVV